MKNKKIFTLLVAMLVGFTSFAQKPNGGIKLTIKHNTGSGTYEVYAKPTFTKQNYLWGQSVISVVVPASVNNESFRISSQAAGAWQNPSNVFSPKANPTSDYHFIYTAGEKANLTAGVETLLFSFPLPATVEASQVRLFENATDPSSSASGMQGGDYRITTEEALSMADVYLGNYTENVTTDTKVITAVESKTAPLEGSSSLTVFPNILAKGKPFNISLKGIAETDAVTVIVSTETGSELMRIVGSRSELEKKSLLLPIDTAAQHLVVKATTAKGTFSKRLVAE